MADTPTTSAPFGDAQAAIDTQNRQLLQVMAGVRTQGDAQYAQQTGAGQADKAAALQQLLTSAIFKGQGTPGPGQGDAAAQPAALAANVGGAFDQRIGTTGQLGAAFDAASQARADAAGQYMREATAAVPVVEARTNEHIATLHAAAQAKATSDAMALQLEQYRLQAAQAAAAKAAAPQTLGQFIGANGGADVVGTALGQSTAAARDAAEQRATNDTTASLAIGGGAPGDAASIDAQFGAPPGTTAALIANAGQTDAAQQRAAAPSDPTRLKVLQGTTDYASTVAAVQKGMIGGSYSQAIQRVLDTHKGMPYSDAALIVKDAYDTMSAGDQKKVGT